MILALRGRRYSEERGMGRALAEKRAVGARRVGGLAKVSIRVMVVLQREA
jgi:hypothetical protein